MKQSDENTISLNIPIHQLQPGQYQPRKFFDENALSALANTIKEQGIIQPIVVRTLRPLSSNLSFQKYEIIAGERRWRAAQIANIEKIPCLIKNYSDEQAARIALIENTHREALNPIDEGCC
jgi:ParB family chromosome partitioning protein